MGELKIGSLFSGYGGLDMAVESVTGAKTVWVSDIDKGACKILAHRYSDVPNHGDLTQIDWAAIEPVDIITGGFPCQDLSHAGKGAGMTADSRSGLWSYMRDAINIIRPRLVVAENVRGLLSAEALRPVEPCTWCVGDEPDLDMRALGAVLADLADIGYDASWYGLRAADVGACHGRWRCFVVAYPAGGGLDGRSRQQVGSARRGVAAPGARPNLLPTPRTSDTNGAGAHGEGGVDLRTAVSLLPTPTLQDGANNGGPSQFDRNSLPLNTLVTLLPTPVVTDAAGTRNATAVRSDPNSNHHAGVTLTDALLPTPMVGSSSPAAHGQISGQFRDAKDAALANFGQYASAIARWQDATGRPAPPPTEPTGRGGAHRLSPKFTEWMMGLPAGWITDVPGLTRNEALKACGNGVVPQQAAAAIRRLLSVSEVAA